jgi:hypothetical protein
MGEAALLSISSIDEKTDRVADFASLHTLLPQVRIVATTPVIEAATKLARHAVDSHSKEGADDLSEPVGQTFARHVASNSMLCV